MYLLLEIYHFDLKELFYLLQYYILRYLYIKLKIMKNRLIINYLLPVALNVLVPYSPEENVTEDGTNKTDPLAQFPVPTLLS